MQRPLIHEAQKHGSTEKDTPKEALTAPDFQKRRFSPRCSSKGGEKGCSTPFCARASLSGAAGAGGAGARRKVTVGRRARPLAANHTPWFPPPFSRAPPAPYGRSPRHSTQRLIPPTMVCRYPPSPPICACFFAQYFIGARIFGLAGQTTAPCAARCGRRNMSPTAAPCAALTPSWYSRHGC